MLVLVRNFFYTPDTSFSEVFLLYSSSWVLVRSHSYTPQASFSEKFPLRT